MYGPPGTIPSHVMDNQVGMPQWVLSGSRACADADVLQIQCLPRLLWRRRPEFSLGLERRDRRIALEIFRACDIQKKATGWSSLNDRSLHIFCPENLLLYTRYLISAQLIIFLFPCLMRTVNRRTYSLLLYLHDHIKVCTTRERSSAITIAILYTSWGPKK